MIFLPLDRGRLSKNYLTKINMTIKEWENIVNKQHRLIKELKTGLSVDEVKILNEVLSLERLLANLEN